MAHEGHDHDHSHPHGHGHPQGHHHHPHHHPHHHHGEALPESVEAHRRHAPAQVAAFVVTCSDSRDAAHDESGRRLQGLLEEAGHTVAGYRLIPDEAAALEAALGEAAAAGARAVLVTGGTGISRRDVTVETLERLFEKRLPGFGELFRALSFQEIGSPAMLSRATAGTWRGLLVFALPGSPHAVRLGMERLILPELGHAVREMMR